MNYSKTCVNGHSQKDKKIGFQDHLSLNGGQGEHSAILLTFIKLPFVIKIFVFSILEWSFYTGFTVKCNIAIIGCPHAINILISGNVTVNYMYLQSKMVQSATELGIT